MGNPRKPRHLKIIAGTDQPCRRQDEPAGELGALEETPEAPDWLPNAHATKFWKRIAPICIRIGTLTEGTIEKFGHMCAIHGRIVAKSSANDTPPMAMYAQLRAYMSDFGLSSLAIGKPKPPGGNASPPKGRFDRFRRD